jgi:hypothetical protein
LHLVEQSLADDCRVTAGNELPINDHPPGVVRVGQHAMQLGCRDGLFTKPAAGWSGGQTEVGHGRFEAFDGVLAGRI